MARLSLIFALGVLSSILLSTPAAAAGDWAWPVRGDVISPYRNGADPYATGQHRGIDIAAPVGRTVAAPTGGRVTFAGTAGSSGLTVSVRTTDGRWDTSYLHLSSVAVREGESVGRGERLGAVGTSGRRSAEASHLHFGVREAGSRHAYRDPLGFLAPLAGPGASPGPLLAPVPAPARPRPGSAPAPAGRRVAPSPVRRPTGARAPAGAPGLVPPPAALRAGSALDRALRPATPGLSPAPAGATSPAAGESRPQQAGAATGPAFGPAAASNRAPAPLSAGPRAGAREEGGFDLGWALGCFGVAAAALAVGRPQARHAVVSRGRATALKRLAPLLGGR